MWNGTWVQAPPPSFAVAVILCQTNPSYHFVKHTGVNATAVRMGYTLSIMWWGKDRDEDRNGDGDTIWANYHPHFIIITIKSSISENEKVTELLVEV
jgi:hypothetical protein